MRWSTPGREFRLASRQKRPLPHAGMAGSPGIGAPLELKTCFIRRGQGGKGTARMGVHSARRCLSVKLHNEIQSKQNALTWWSPSGSSRNGVARLLTSSLGKLDEAFWVLEREGCFALAPGSLSQAGVRPFEGPGTRVAGFLPPLPMRHLGDPGFRTDHRLRYSYVAGAMANGIASVTIGRSPGAGGDAGLFWSGGFGFAPDRSSD